MKLVIYLLFTLLFIVSPVPKSRPAVKKIEFKQVLVEDYSKKLDSALLKERNKNKRLREKCLEEVHLIVIQNGRSMEENICRLASN